jgi:hypothetical protein
MRAEIEQILQLQNSWSSENTDEMEQRGKLIRHDIPRELRPSLDQFIRQMPVGLNDFQLDGRDATGRKSEIPWVRAFSKARSPKATEGWYLVYLFDAFGAGAYLSINQGTNTWRDGDLLPRRSKELNDRANWARGVLSSDRTLRTDLVEEIDLPVRNSKLAAQYEHGNVLAIRYESDSIPSDQILLEDFAYMTRLLSELYEDVDNTLLVPGDPSPEVVDALALANDAAGNPRRVGRFRLNPAERLAIELRAVKVATAYLKTQGFRTKDVGATHSYDIHARKGDAVLHVEVKGTVSDGAEVILTKNEVALHRLKYPDTMLAIVSGICLDRTGMQPIASGGSIRILHPWKPENDALTALTYAYQIPIGSGSLPLTY